VSDIESLLAMQTWAVVGLSDNRSRAAWDVARFLQGKGKSIVPVHPAAPLVHGRQGVLALGDVPVAVDVVDCFVRSELVGPVVDEAIAIGARGVWMQLGVVDAAAAALRRRAGRRHGPVPQDRVARLIRGRTGFKAAGARSRERASTRAVHVCLVVKGCQRGCQGLPAGVESVRLG